MLVILSLDQLNKRKDSTDLIVDTLIDLKEFFNPGERKIDIKFALFASDTKYDPKLFDIAKSHKYDYTFQHMYPEHYVFFDSKQRKKQKFHEGDIWSVKRKYDYIILNDLRTDTEDLNKKQLLEFGYGVQIGTSALNDDGKILWIKRWADIDYKSILINQNEKELKKTYKLFEQESQFINTMILPNFNRVYERSNVLFQRGSKERFDKCLPEHMTIGKRGGLILGSGKYVNKRDPRYREYIRCFRNSLLKKNKLDYYDEKNIPDEVNSVRQVDRLYKVSDQPPKWNTNWFNYGPTIHPGKFKEKGKGLIFYGNYCGMKYLDSNNDLQNIPGQFWRDHPDELDIRKDQKKKCKKRKLETDIHYEKQIGKGFEWAEDDNTFIDRLNTSIDNNELKLHDSGDINQRGSPLQYQNDPLTPLPSTVNYDDRTPTPRTTDTPLEPLSPLYNPNDINLSRDDDEIDLNDGGSNDNFSGPQEFPNVQTGTARSVDSARTIPKSKYESIVFQVLRD
jgi:hypothetical protein